MFYYFASLKFRYFFFSLNTIYKIYSIKVPNWTAMLLDWLLGGWQLLLTPGLRKRLMCLCRRAWFCWFPAQKFCRNWWASFMMSCMRRSSPWKRNAVV